ncbi:hypothetical protein J1G42_00765 [Cellulomonas sp. zg-ZUI222]|uniref:Uncharacterized protein n=1 Tax=Cellulomonas wangleii TaxID=2816956 RepID=A0ABX8D9Q3_9CELL|nr:MULTISPECIES: hypothetical protein [Cellulomonas]MBO0898493.1 hypothetical protein [Cellulomonas sp. zg-ZUI22]MBO0919357.1 hypothetical protein [Cellulomonas wangleii]MBO0924497.1 hypothetical protein [Cellulomonas wangleii]QVI62487.1 hypothetical protein KG103_00550 [Cellulomonas wangleii]
MTWALLILISVAPTVLLCLVWSLIPSPDEPPRWRTALADRLEALAGRLRRRRPDPYDPFLTLRVQERLGAVADHVRRLEVDEHTFARAERIIASQLAYDQLLAEACRLAGVEVRPAALGDPQERFREEVELAARGWTW